MLGQKGLKRMKSVRTAQTGKLLLKEEESREFAFNWKSKEGTQYYTRHSGSTIDNIKAMSVEAELIKIYGEILDCAQIY